MNGGATPAKRTVHAVFINAAECSVTNVEIEPGLNEYYKLIGCDIVAIGMHFPNGDILFVDDNGLLKDPRNFFKLSPHGTTFAGNGLIIGREVEDESDAGFHIEDAQTRAENLGAIFMSL